MAGTPIFDVLVVETRDGYSAQVVNSSAGGELAAQPFHLPLDLSPMRVLYQGSTSGCAGEPAVAIDGDGRQHIVWVSQGLDGAPDVYHATLDQGE